MEVSGNNNVGFPEAKHPCNLVAGNNNNENGLGLLSWLADGGNLFCYRDGRERQQPYPQTEKESAFGSEAGTYLLYLYRGKG